MRHVTRSREQWAGITIEAEKGENWSATVHVYAATAPPARTEREQATRDAVSAMLGRLAELSTELSNYLLDLDAK